MILQRLNSRSAVIALAFAAMLATSASATPPPRNKPTANVALSAKQPGPVNHSKVSLQVERIARQVREIESRAKQCRRLDLDNAREYLDIHEDTIAFLQGNDLRKVVVSSRFWPDEVRELYFEHGKPIFVLFSTYAWKPNKAHKTDIPQLVQWQERYYIDDLRIIRSLSGKPKDVPGSMMTAKELQGLVKNIRADLAKTVRHTSVDPRTGNLIAFWTKYSDGPGHKVTQKPMLVTRPYAAFVVWHSKEKRFLIYDNKAKRTFSTADFNVFLAELDGLPRNISILRFDICCASQMCDMPASERRRLDRVMRAGHRKWIEPLGDALADACGEDFIGFRYP